MSVRIFSVEIEKELSGSKSGMEDCICEESVWQDVSTGIVPGVFREQSASKTEAGSVSASASRPPMGQCHRDA